MGDHEALGTVRKELCKDPVGKDIVADKSFVPLIILNAPFYVLWQVMGQVDVYPTLLDLLGLNDYWWKGLGESIFNPQKPDFDVDPSLILSEIRPVFPMRISVRPKKPGNIRHDYPL